MVFVLLSNRLDRLYAYMLERLVEIKVSIDDQSTQAVRCIDLHRVYARNAVLVTQLNGSLLRCIERRTEAQRKRHARSD
jgi:hypothetical protein